MIIMNAKYLRKLRPIGIIVLVYIIILCLKGLHQGLVIQDNKLGGDISALHKPGGTRHHVNRTSRTTNDSMVAITPFLFPSDDEMASMNALDLMYLFGHSDNDFSFEENVIKLFGCQVFTFDPSMDELKPEAIKAPTGCKFTPIGLGASNYVNKEGWKIKTFDEIQRNLNHSNEVIDILKVDIEGMEWDTFDEMLKAGSFKRVKQLQVEIHFYDNEFFTRCHGNRQQAIDCYWKALRKHQVIVRKKRLGLLKRLNEFGLNVFSSEGNTFYENSQEYTKNGVFVTPLTEFSFINVNYLK